MKENSSVVRFRQPDEIDDSLTSNLRSGARQLLTQAYGDGGRGVPRRHEGSQAA
jgi:hypothetical protein